MTVCWRFDEGALALLESHGGPFESRAVRRAFAAARPGTVDASVGGQLDDGTTAALAVLTRRGVGLALPWAYAAVRASRELSVDELVSFHTFARRRARVAVLVIREVAALSTGAPNARSFATTHIVRVRADPSDAYPARARRNLRDSVRSGVTAARAVDASAFCELYARASDRYDSAYSRALLDALDATGFVRCYNASVGDTTIASAFALCGLDHWCYWLGAQNEEGRKLSASYAAVDALLRDAAAAGISVVNLGSSEVGGRTLEGVAWFKSRLGGEVVPMVETTVAVPGAGPLLDAARRFRAGRRFRRVLSNP